MKLFSPHKKPLIALLLCLAEIAYAQTVEDLKSITSEYEANLHSFSLYGENSIFPKEGDFTYHFGTRLDLSVGRVGFYYKIGVGKSPEGTTYVHAPGGLVVAGALAWYGISGGQYYLWVPVVLCAIIPEGITVRLWQRKNATFQLYASPWGAELNYSKEFFVLISGEAGMRVTILQKDRYLLSCYAGGKTLYNAFNPAATVGATVGIVLR